MPVQPFPVDVSNILRAYESLAAVNARNAAIEEQRRAEREARRANRLGSIGALAGAGLGFALGGPPGALIGLTAGQQVGGAVAGQPIDPVAIASVGFGALNLQQQQAALARQQATSQKVQSALNPPPIIDETGFETAGQPDFPRAISAIAGQNPLAATQLGLQLAAQQRRAAAPNIRLVTLPSGEVRAVNVAGLRGGETIGAPTAPKPNFTIERTKDGRLIAIDKNAPRATPIPIDTPDPASGLPFPEVGSSEKISMLRFLTAVESDLANQRPVTQERAFLAQNFRRLLTAPLVVGSPQAGFQQIQRPPLPAFGRSSRQPTPQAALPAPPSATVTPLTERQPRPLPFSDAAKLAATRQALDTFRGVKAKILNKDGTPNRAIILQMDANIPFTQGRQIRQELADAYEARIRSESGAAVPQSEIERMERRLTPTSLDSDDGVRSKLDRAEAFFEGTLQLFDIGRDILSDDTEKKIRGAATEAGPADPSLPTLSTIEQLKKKYNLE